MRILSSFSDFYDVAAAAKGREPVYHRRDPLFPGLAAVQLASHLDFPDPTGLIRRRYKFELDFLLITGTLWPILRTKSGAVFPVKSDVPQRKALDMRPWEVFALNPVGSIAATNLQTTIGAPIARIAPSTYGRVWVYPDSPRLETYGIQNVELPERVALWIELWLKRNPQLDSTSTYQPVLPFRRLR